MKTNPLRQRSDRIDRTRRVRPPRSFAPDVHALISQPHASSSSLAFVRGRGTRDIFSATRSMIIGRLPSRPMYTRRDHRSRSFVAEPHALISQPHAARSSVGFLRGRCTRVKLVARVRSCPNHTRSFLSPTRCWIRSARFDIPRTLFACIHLASGFTVCPCRRTYPYGTRLDDAFT